MPLPRARGENFFHLRQRKIQFFIAIVKVRREPHACGRAVIHQHVARDQLALHFLGVRTFDRYRAAALFGIARRIHFPAARQRTVHQSLRLPLRFLADFLDADFRQDLEARLAGVERRNVRRAVQEAERIVAQIDRADFEFKWTAVRAPAGKRGDSFLRKSGRT